MRLMNIFYTRFKLAGLALSILLILSSCGFHLRGAFDLPVELQSVFISAKSSTILVEDLKTILDTNGATVSSDATLATASINIEKEKNSQRVLSVDSNGKAREYELQYHVVFSVSVVKDGQHSQLLIENKKLELVRDFVYDATAVLGQGRERSVLIRDMQRDAARLIMLQIQAAYRKQNQFDTSTPDTEVSK